MGGTEPFGDIIGTCAGPGGKAKQQTMHVCTYTEMCAVMAHLTIWQPKWQSRRGTHI